jgi:hypothetical protein
MVATSGMSSSYEDVRNANDNRDRCTGYIGHLFGKNGSKWDRVCLHWLQMAVQPGYNVRM